MLTSSTPLRVHFEKKDLVELDTHRVCKASGGQQTIVNRANWFSAGEPLKQIQNGKIEINSNMWCLQDFQTHQGKQIDYLNTIYRGASGHLTTVALQLICRVLICHDRDTFSPFMNIFQVTKERKYIAAQRKKTAENPLLPLAKAPTVSHEVGT